MSGVRNLKLEVILSTIDKATRPLKAVMAGAKSTSSELKALRDRLKELKQSSELIGKFREISKSAAITANQLKLAQDKVKQLNTSMAATASPSRAMTKALDDAKKAASELKQRHSQLIERQQRLRDSMNTAGIATKNLAQQQLKLKGDAKSVTDAIKQQEGQLQKLSRTQQRASAARARYQQATQLQAQLGGTALHAGGVKDGILQGLRNPVTESKHYQNELTRIRALGIGEKEAARAKQFATELKAYGVSATEKLELHRDAWAVFADRHHAEMVTPVLTKMKFANKTLFGEEGAQEKDRQLMDMMKVIEMRGGANTQKEFLQQANKVQQVIAATGGRVGPNEWYRYTKRSGLAGQGLSNDAFYYKMEPVIQEMGGDTAGQAWMSAYQNLYQGRTTKRAALLLEKFDLIGDKSKVKHDKAGQVSFLNPGALKGAATFKTDPFKWIDEILLPTLEKKGIKSAQQIEDVLGGIFTNRNASGLFGKMVLQRKQFAKSAAVNAKADNIDQVFDKAKDTASGKELELIARRANAFKTLGDSIMPAYTRALELAAAATEKLTNWMEANPAAAKAITLSLTTIAIAIAALAAVLGPIALLRFGLGMLGVQAKEGAAGTSRLGAAMGNVGKAMMWLGRVFLMNPIGLVITAIAAAAYLIWDNWDTLGPKFQALWDTIKGGVQAAWDWIKAKVMLVADAIGDFLMNWTIVGFISDHWQDLKAITLAIWALIKSGIASAAQSIFDFFMNWTIVGVIVRHWDVISASASAAWQWVKDKAIAAGHGIADFFMNWTLLGLVVKHWDSITSFMSGLVGKFMTIGAQIMQGLVNGFLGGLTMLKNAVNGVGESAIDWFKEKLGIHSPSRVFAELGGYTMAGLHQGIVNQQDGPLGAVNTVARKLTAAGAGLALSAGGAMAGGVPIDKRAPISTQRTAPTVAAPQYHITIQGTPGMNEQQLAQLVVRELDRRERQTAARGRSRLTDND